MSGDGFEVRALTYDQFGPGSNCRTWCHTWVEFVAGSCPCSEDFYVVSPVFLPPPQKTLQISIRSAGKWPLVSLLTTNFYFYFTEDTDTEKESDSPEGTLQNVMVWFGFTFYDIDSNSSVEIMTQLMSMWQSVYTVKHSG